MGTEGGFDRLHIDIETFSSVDIGKAGLHKYVQSPDFQILLFAYSLNEAPVEVVDLASGEKVPPAQLGSLADPRTSKAASNAVFAWTCLSRNLVALRHGSRLLLRTARRT